jgi:ferric-dicitrate binding protein FerR (iron transport regulator)
MTDELIFKYISGQTNTDESIEIQNWVQESEGRKQELARLKNVWVIAGLNNEIDPVIKNDEIDRIWKTIRQLSQKEQKRRLQILLTKYAAAILFLVGFSGTLGYFISHRVNVSPPEMTEIIVPRGQRSSIVLPDGSNVQLNSDSHLKFISFQTGKRKVILDGEGFFQVTHDHSRPFVVEARGVEIEVLGTTFNVSSYPNDSVITTYLVNGKVKISNTRDEVVLSPSEVYKYNRTTHESSKMKVSDQRFSNWTKGVLTVEGETIAELSKKLERRYNVRIFFGDEEVKQHMYTGSIRDENLKLLLDALEFASSITYKQKGDSIILYSKR